MSGHTKNSTDSEHIVVRNTLIIIVVLRVVESKIKKIKYNWFTFYGFIFVSSSYGVSKCDIET